MPMAFKRYFMPPAFNPDGVFWDVISIGFTPGASAPLRDSLGRPPWLVTPPTILSTASTRFGSASHRRFSILMSYVLCLVSPSYLRLSLVYSGSSLVRTSFGPRSELLRNTPERGPNKVRMKED